MRGGIWSVLVVTVAVLVTGLAGGPPSEYAGGGRSGVTAAGAVAAGELAPASDFGWPLRPTPTVSRPFQPPSRPYGPGHRGADLVGTAGQLVLAAGAGVVVYAGPLADRGVVSIDHAGALRTSYEPVLATVRAGQLVRRGETLGSLVAGHSGCPAAACLHWGLRRDGGYLDPLLLVRRGHVRLLPWPPAAR